ncbi:MAG: ABC transporter ATP-binding protein [Candidatus Bathyarchaeia archaeon]
MAVKLVINNVSFSYRSAPALRNICFELGRGEILSLVGPNGSGKSTLLKCIDGILKPQGGAVFFNGKQTCSMNPKELSTVMGYVPQSMTSAASMFPFTVFDVVLAGRKPYIGWSVSERDIEVVANILRFMGIADLAARNFNELSGGEQQKVMIARALAQLPRILLMDEPTSNLDIKHQLEVLQMIHHLCKNMGLSVVMAMHDLNLASRFSDKMVMLKNGSIFAAGSPENVITEKNIIAVYGVRAHVSLTRFGKPQVIPIEPINAQPVQEIPARISMF